VDKTKPLVWRKSSFSASGDNCVEVAYVPEGGHAVRDSKNPGGPMLSYTRREWRAFIAGVKNGKIV
jgi:hypothetical protein